MGEELTIDNESMARALYQDERYVAVKAIVNSVLSDSYSTVITEFKKLLSEKEISNNVYGIMPYIYAAGFLSFAGRDINKQTLSTIMKATGRVPDDNMIEIIINSGVKSHLIYIYTYYFLIANGIAPDEENVMNVIKALGLEPDPSAMKHISKLSSFTENI